MQVEQIYQFIEKLILSGGKGNICGKRVLNRYFQDISLFYHVKTELLDLYRQPRPV